MLTKDELETYKKYADPYLTEKDYLQEIILRGIYTNRRSTRSFVFKGGTALSKFYFSDRFSEDLDFTLIKTDETVDHVDDLIEEVRGRLFYPAEFIKKPSTNEFGTVSAEIGIEGPRYNKKPSTLQHIRLEINTTSKLAHAPIQLPRQQVYSDMDTYIGTVMDKREILSEKFRAIMSRGRHHKERDLYDINFLTEKGVLPERSEILQKLGEANMQFSEQMLLSEIDKIEPNWKNLAPFVSHRIEDYGYVKENVINKFKAAGIL